MHEDIVKKIDSSLTYIKSFRDEPYAVYKVERQGVFYVFKFNKANEKGVHSFIMNEKNVLVRAQHIEGITHLVEYYGRKGHYEILLKEYFEGQKLSEFETHRILDKKMSDYLNDTVRQLHSLGITYLDIHSSNIIVSPDFKSVKIIDLDLACFADLMPLAAFEISKGEDFKRLEGIISVYGI